MKVTREQAEANRAAIVEAAARLFREHGFSNVSVADIAREAGLTHGALYSHFKSKTQLEAEASKAVISGAAEFWRNVVAENPGRPLAALVEGYLSHDHLGDSGAGCAFAALGPELARSDDDVRRAAAEALPKQLRILTDLMPGKDEAARRKKALDTYTSLVGAVVVARAVSDRTLIEEIFATVLASILNRTNGKKG